MSYTKSRAGVRRKIEHAPEKVRAYFRHAPELLDGKYPYEVIIARLELAHNMTVYCGIVKLHRGDSEVTRNVLNAHHMTRAEFKRIFEDVYGKALKKEIACKLDFAERIRDKTMHGKDVKDSEYREAIVTVVGYAEAFNNFMFELAGFQPFGNLQGFKGRGEALDKKTTRWILKGMGMSSS